MDYEIASDFDFNDLPRSGRSTEVSDGKIKALIESKLRYMTQKFAETLNFHHSSVHNHLKKLDYVSNLDIWIPNDHKKFIWRRV